MAIIVKLKTPTPEIIRQILGEDASVESLFPGEADGLYVVKCSSEDETIRVLQDDDCVEYAHFPANRSEFKNG